jgi:hypothetical protein
MANTYKQLAQMQGTGSAASAYSPDSGQTAIITDITVANTTAGALSFSLYNDDDGTTYTAATQILGTTSVPANSTYEKRCRICMNNAAGNLAINAPAGLTLTAWGVLIT